ncbi:MAG: AAA family ATPase [Mycobacterium sp.]
MGTLLGTFAKRTSDLRKLLTVTTQAGAKTIFVGDPHQLAPVKARGGMFAQLCEDLPGPRNSPKSGGCATPRNAPLPSHCATATRKK